MDRQAVVSASAVSQQSSFGISRRGLVKGMLGAAAFAMIGKEMVSSASAATATRYITTTAVNLRKSSSTNSQILKVVPEGAVVLDYDLVVENGFRGVDYNGTVGWIYSQYLILENEETGPITFTTTTAVNLRKSSNSSSKILKVLPAGAKVIDYDLVIENGYRGVDYNGLVGWIYDDYLTQ